MITTNYATFIHVRIRLITLCLSLAFWMAFVFFVFSPSSIFAQQTDFIAQEVKDLLIKYHYSFPNEQQLSEKSIPQMIEKIADPYAQYLTEKEFISKTQDKEQYFYGLGISIIKKEQGFFITEVAKQSDAFVKNLQINDQLLEINGHLLTKEQSIDEIVTFIYRTENAKNQLTLLRNQQRIHVEVISQLIDFPHVDSLWLAPGTGYIKLTEFSEKSARQFDIALDGLETKGISTLIIDLRNNPGGYELATKHIFSRFVDQDILYYSAKKGEMKFPTHVKKHRFQSRIPLVILVNENSASASELLAGALHDYKLAIVVGTQSFGKGTMQNHFRLTDGSYFKMTTEEFFTPLINKVNKIGIKPDYIVADSFAQLLTAFRLAGVDTLHINVSDHTLQIDSLSFSNNHDIMYTEGQTYMSMDSLSAWLEQDMSWNDQERHLQVVSDNNRKTIHLADSKWFKYQDKIYLELTHLTQQIGHFSYQRNGTILSLYRTERM